MADATASGAHREHGDLQATACVSLNLGVGELRMPDVLRAMQLHAVTGTDHAANKVRKNATPRA